MRVALVGRPASRLRLRSQLSGAPIEIVAEFDTAADARAAAIHVDALLVGAHEAGSGPARPEDADENAGEPLTAREVQVLELLAEGLANRMIADRLGISDQTVKFHVASILGKLGAANRTEAVRRAMRRGVISL